MKFHVAGFEPESIVDGPGFRYVIFFQGCPHHCDECQNPNTWSYDQDKGFYIDQETLIKNIEENPLISGVTFSGGEPFSQSKNILSLAKELKRKNYNIWCFTGYKYEEIKDDPLLNYIDILVDGKFIKNEKSLELLFRGSKNQRLIDVQKTKLNNKIILWDENLI